MASKKLKKVVAIAGIGIVLTMILVIISLPAIDAYKNNGIIGVLAYVLFFAIAVFLVVLIRKFIVWAFNILIK